jgi:hypothetical protein
MRTILLIAILFSSTFIVSAQRVNFSGTIFDPSGAVVVGANVVAIYSKSKSMLSCTSNTEGVFNLDLEPGLYSLEVNKDGFLTLKYPEFLLVNSTTGMRMDFVMFGARYHEPCGVSGGDCLPTRMLIRNYSLKYSPSLKQIAEDFSDINRN